MGDEILNQLLVLIIGLPCSGKTTLAKKIAKEFGFTHFTTEDIRIEYLNNCNCAPNWEDCDFSPEQLKYVYNEIVQRASRALIDGKSIIIDGVYRNEMQRASVFNIAENNTNLMVLPYYLYCDENESLRRLIERKQIGTNAPAGVSGYKTIKELFVEPDFNVFEYIDTTNGIDSVFSSISEYISGVL